MTKLIVSLAMAMLSGLIFAQDGDSEQIEAATEIEQAEQAIETLAEPLYNPFVERYVLDELKSLRSEMASQKHELMQQIIDRELSSVDRGVTYATDTITYFFYLVAAASSILVIVGWTSIKDIKDRVHSFANQEITNLINEYESRLANIEKQLRLKSQDIEDNREEIEATREIHSLWLKAQQEQSPSGKIDIYDQILKLNANDVEALTYKADAVLELEEPQWALNLCNQALVIDDDNAHAYFQLACAYTSLGYYEEAARCVVQTYQSNENYREAILSEALLQPLNKVENLEELLATTALEAGDSSHS